MLNDVDKEFDLPTEDENGEPIETNVYNDVYEEEEEEVEHDDEFYEANELKATDEQEIDTTAESEEQFNEASEQLKEIYTAVLASGFITEEQLTEIEVLNAQVNEAYDDILGKEKTDIEKLKDRVEELKEGFVGASPDEILNILTENGTKCWLYKDDDDNVLIDGTSIPELTVLVNKFKMIATDGENEGEFTLNPDFIQMVVKDTGTGDAVKSIDNMYYLSTSKYELIGGTWVSILPTSQEQQGKFLWIKTVTTYMDESKQPTETQPICVSSQDGENGADGVDGKDGVSLVYKGEFASHPSNPQNGWYYRNTSEGKTFVYQSGAWYQMTIDGQDGQKGNDGKDGLSIEYKGELKNPPSNPVKNWTYKDSDNGIVYIYTGTAWEVMTYDGSDGIDGTDGTDGLSVFVTYHDSLTQPYAPTGDGTSGGWHTNCTSNSVWISQKVSSNANTGTWGTPIKIKGQDGTTYYTWIMYADDQYGNGISNNPTGKEYIGFAYNKTTPTESTNKNEYTWSLIKGTDGVPGRPGQDGITYYTWIKYSDYSNGNPCYDIPNNNTKYIGIATNKTTSYESSDYTQYNWSLFKGADGVPGQDGVSVEEVVIEYAKNQYTTTAPTTGWSTSMPSYQKGYYLWYRTRIKYSNSSYYVYSTPVCDQSWKASQEVYTQYEQLKDKFTWIVSSGTSQSNMVLSEKLYELTTQRAIISAKKIELNGSININGGTFRVDTSGNMTCNSGTFKGAITGGTININNNFKVTSGGSMTATSADISGKVTITSGSININNGLFRVLTNGNTKIGGQTGNIVEGYDRALLEITSNGNLYSVSPNSSKVYTKLSEGTLKIVNSSYTLTIDDAFASNKDAVLRSSLNSSTGGQGGSIWLCCNGGDIKTEDSRAIRFFKNSNGDYVFRPNSKQGVMYLGTATYPFGNVISKKLTQTSDRTLKENIAYLSNAISTYNPSGEITIEDCYNFVSNDLPITTYNYIDDNDKKIGFIAQDLLYNKDETDNKIGQLIVNPKGYTDEDGKLTYDLGNYVSVLAGALQVAIRKIKTLEDKINGSN